MAQFSMAPMFGKMQPAGMVASAGANMPWVVTPQERLNYDTQFDKLNPINGFLRGDQARNFFLQSNLPPTVLGQIWELADLTADGKMDKLEFSIAMKLIKLKLQGAVLPLTLPLTMKQQPNFATSSYSTPGISNSSFAMSNGSVMMQSTQPGLPGSANSSRRSSTSETASTRPVTEWSVPKQTKLKYNQLFNSNDRNKIGFLTGVQARHILNGTGLPQMTLANVWQLSDVDKDGKLTQEEFVLAMHLCDTAKAGNPLPNVLPPHLIPPSYRSAQMSQPSGQLGLLTPLTQMEPTAKASAAESSVFTTFEDKRRDNFQKGNLELEKRRLALLEIQQKERERLEQKEREEREKREKERLEQERKKQEELERQLERQREAEREREEQRRKAIEQKEAAQREMERQRQLEWERLRRKELLQHKLREQELVVSLRAKTKTLDVELSSQQEKRLQLRERVQDLEKRLKDQSGELTMLNNQRELKHTVVQKQQEQVELFNHQLSSLLPEKQLLNERIQFKGNTDEDTNLQHSQRDYQTRTFAVQRLRTELEETEAQKSKQTSKLEQLTAQLNRLREDLNKQTLDMENLNRLQQDKLRDLQEARRQKDINQTRKSSTEDKKQRVQLASAALARKQEMDQKKEEERIKLQQEAAKRREEEEKRKQVQKVMEENQRAMQLKLQEEERKQQQLKEQQEEQRRQQQEEQRRQQQEEQRRQQQEEQRRQQQEHQLRQQQEQQLRQQKEEEAKRKAAEEEAKKEEIKRKVAEMQLERMKQKQKGAASAATTANQVGHGKSAQGFGLVLSKDPAHLVKYRALYTFTARNPDELSINAEDVIIVDTSQDAEPDWLAGSKGNVCGWFPANYVERVPGPAIQPPPQSAKPNKVDSADSFGVGQQASAFTAAQKSFSSNVNGAKAPEISQRYRAVYPWIAKKENHLTFDKDDIVTVSEKQEMWWFGHCKTKSGWFPKSYVKEVSSTTPTDSSRPVSPKSSPVLKRKAPAPPTNAAATSALYQASYAFTGTEDGDLSFNTGDVITVTSMDGEWWTGTLKGKSGIFPANYVAPHKVEQKQPQQAKTTTLGKPEVATVIAAYQATGQEQLSLSVGQIVSIRKKNESGWWEGELQARGKKKQIGWFPANYVKLMTAGGSSGKSTPAADKAKASLKPSSVCRVMAMYDYTAQNIDELTFLRGDVITVDDKSDPDWWKGTLGANSGLFPSNYVQDASTR